MKATRLAGALAALAWSIVAGADVGNPAARQQADFETRSSPEEKLVWSAAQGDIAMVDSLLARNVSVDAASRKHGMTALMGASAQGHLRIVKRLLDAGADIDALDRFGASALVNACNYGKLAIVRLLLARGAAVDGPASGALTTPLVAAVQGGNLAVVQALLDAGAAPRRAAQGGMTPLVAAAYAGRAEMSRMLLGRGADAESVRRAVEAATAANHPDLVRVLSAVSAR